MRHACRVLDTFAERTRNASELVEFLQSQKPEEGDDWEVFRALSLAACRWKDYNLWRDVVRSCDLRTVFNSDRAGIVFDAIGVFGFVRVRKQYVYLLWCCTSELTTVCRLKRVLRHSTSHGMRLRLLDWLEEWCTRRAADQQGNGLSSVIKPWLLKRRKGVVKTLNEPAPTECELLFQVSIKCGGMSFLQDR